MVVTVSLCSQNTVYIVMNSIHHRTIHTSLANLKCASIQETVTLHRSQGSQGTQGCTVDKGDIGDRGYREYKETEKTGEE